MLTNNQNQLQEIVERWKPVLEHPDLPEIKDPHRRAVTATLIENTHNAFVESANRGANQNLLSEDVPTNNYSDGNIGSYDPVLISLVRRAAPNLMAYDIAGVQPMTGPTGLIFALKSRYTNQSGDEALFDEADTTHSTIAAGNTTFGENHSNTTPTASDYNVAQGMTTAELEGMGSNTALAFNEMAFTIDKVSVEAKGRALKADYSLELAQDLKAVHGLNAEAEISNILATEILTEINREVVRTVNITAKRGSQGTVTTDGIFDLDTDANGRWAVEKFKGLLFHLGREANVIAKRTRRGKGNIMICSSDVATALQAAGVLDYTPALNTNLQVDDTGNTFAGVLNNTFRVYIDPYTTGDYFTMGYKGAGAFDAGLFYCPYVPLQMVRAIDQDTFQPKIGFKTRYGMVANPFHTGSGATSSALVPDTNEYYRLTQVVNLM